MIQSVNQTEAPSISNWTSCFDELQRIQRAEGRYHLELCEETLNCHRPTEDNATFPKTMFILRLHEGTLQPISA